MTWRVTVHSAHTHMLSCPYQRGGRNAGQEGGPLLLFERLGGVPLQGDGHLNHRNLAVQRCGLRRRRGCWRGRGRGCGGMGGVGGRGGCGGGGGVGVEVVLHAIEEEGLGLRVRAYTRSR